MPIPVAGTGLCAMRCCCLESGVVGSCGILEDTRIVLIDVGVSGDTGQAVAGCRVEMPGVVLVGADRITLWFELTAVNFVFHPC